MKLLKLAQVLALVSCAVTPSEAILGGLPIPVPIIPNEPIPTVLPVCPIDVDDSCGLGRTFDGIGAISGGGATSKLLVNYPKNQLSDILDYLFKPNFGASLDILKVEIGGDAQSSDGCESSHMHAADDENYSRGYEWWLMTEAKKRNPAIKLYGLPWAFPRWVGNGTFDPYFNPNVTATYVVNWIKGKKKYYNLDIDYIGEWNERPYCRDYIMALKAKLVENGLTNVKIVVADMIIVPWPVCDDLLVDQPFDDAIDVVGGHYVGTQSTPQCIALNKSLWDTEDSVYASDPTTVPGGCWARILVQNYVNGFMTSSIVWNLIASYYINLEYGGAGLMTAVEPWSGNYKVDYPIWITAHTTQFTDPGWSYLSHGDGVGQLTYGGSYVSLTDPSRTDLTIIIETLTDAHSQCDNQVLPPVQPQQAQFQLSGSFASISTLYVWRSAFNGSASSVFQQLSPIHPVGGKFNITLNTDELYTITTLNTGQKGVAVNPIPPSQPFPLPYSDNFESYNVSSEAYLFVPQNGVWEVHTATDPSHGQVNRQVVVTEPIAWCLQEYVQQQASGVELQNLHVTLNLGGNYNWSNINISADVLIPSQSGSTGAYVAARVVGGGCNYPNTTGVFFFVSPDTNTYNVTTTIGAGSLQSVSTGLLGSLLGSGGGPVLASGSITGKPLARDVWFNIQLIVQGSSATGSINGVTQSFSATVPSSVSQGFAAYGTSNYGITDFDNFLIQAA